MAQGIEGEVRGPLATLPRAPPLPRGGAEGRLRPGAHSWVLRAFWGALAPRVMGWGELGLVLREEKGS